MVIAQQIDIGIIDKKINRIMILSKPLDIMINQKIPVANKADFRMFFEIFIRINLV